MTKEQAAIYYAWKILRDVDCLSHKCEDCPMAVLNDEDRFTACIINQLGTKLDKWGII